MAQILPFPQTNPGRYYSQEIPTTTEQTDLSLLVEWMDSNLNEEERNLWRQIYGQ